MTKLDRAMALLPIVIKAQKKGHSIDFDLSNDKIDIWHWKFDAKRVHTVITDKRTFDKAMNYLQTLIK